MWLRLKLSPLGAEPCFGYDQFWECPDYLVRRALKELDQWEQREYNMSSLVTARLACLIEAVAAGFGGGKPQSTPLDFLPYPDMFKSSDPSRKSRMSKKTRELFMDLLRRGLIPTDVVVAFSDELNN